MHTQRMDTPPPTQAVVSLPWDLVSSCEDSGCLLDMELWAGQACVACQPVLLLPESLVDLMKEVQAWAGTVVDTAGAAASDQVADFVYDLGQWLLLQAITKEPTSVQASLNPLTSSSSAAAGAAATPEAEGGAARVQLAWVLQTLGQDLYEHAAACGLPYLKALLRQAGHAGDTTDAMKVSNPGAPDTPALYTFSGLPSEVHMRKVSCSAAGASVGQEVTLLCADVLCDGDAGGLRAHCSSPLPIPGLQSVELMKSPGKEGFLRQVSVSFESLSSDDVVGGRRRSKSTEPFLVGDDSELEGASEFEGSFVSLKADSGKGAMRSSMTSREDGQGCKGWPRVREIFPEEGRQGDAERVGELLTFPPALPTPQKGSNSALLGLCSVGVCVAAAVAVLWRTGA
ncbi:hypothetical protein DUNSADRAFT_15371 [Dunaliella salina]|uniref:Uncharacterized protein n=1 Tax=Dunaliella salina TaxID=3046 RepID=A0ABQ7H1U6_DUNSA|nr:hypothetical protein DUNSADRAFT_15371 [Dunaliella salina]|eukprot:KAF5840829.1 hypothetical protein DUNSADRAFT_15371 [Dunaliella salina]